MIPGFEERLQQARVNTNETNCIGTALYLVGLRDTDEYIEPEIAYRNHLAHLEPIRSPAEDCLVAWHLRDRKSIIDTVHLAVVTSLSPMRVTHRRECTRYGGRVEKNVRFSSLCRWYRYSSPFIAYYLQYERVVNRNGPHRAANTEQHLIVAPLLIYKFLVPSSV